MKVIVIVGSESHTSSRASASLECVKDGYWVQTPKEWQQGRMQKPSDAGMDGYDKQNSNWWLLTLDIPAGTKIRYKTTGRTGARGVNEHGETLVYILDEAAEVVEATPDAGLVDGFIKGRMRPVAVAPKKTVDMTSGF